MRITAAYFREGWNKPYYYVYQSVAPPGGTMLSRLNAGMSAGLTGAWMLVYEVLEQLRR